MEDIVIFPDDIFFLSAISRNEKDGYICMARINIDHHCAKLDNPIKLDSEIFKLNNII